MELAELLNSLADEERDFIAGLDYGQDRLKHRLALDLVLARGGQVDMEQEYWFPYEVIELGKSWLQPGRDREYAACLAIVLENIRTGADTSTDLEYLIDSQYDTVATLPSELRQLIDELLDSLI